MTTTPVAAHRGLLLRSLATTPGRYRALAVVCLLALVLTLAGTVATSSALDHRTDRVRTQSGPVLIATQQVFSSLAEANAAATAEYLAGKDDGRAQRRIYEDALERAARQVDLIASHIGDDADAHGALAELLVAVNRYAGAIETAREKKAANAPDADAALAAALAFSAAEITPEVATLLEVTNRRIDADTDPIPLVFALAPLLALVVLVASQVVITRRTNRLVNVPLAAATVIVSVTLVWLVLATSRQRDDVEAARAVGVDSIGLTGSIQATAYEAKVAESLALIGDTAQFDTAKRAAASIYDGVIDPSVISMAHTGARLPGSGLLADAASVADSARERASAAEMLQRWQRYRTTSDSIRDKAQSGADLPGARRLATNEGNGTFNGFNLAVETFLADNRRQFEAHLDAARDRLRALEPGMIVLPLLAAALALWGIQIRWNEYR